MNILMLKLKGQPAKKIVIIHPVCEVLLFPLDLFCMPHASRIYMNFPQIKTVSRLEKYIICMYSLSLLSQQSHCSVIATQELISQGAHYLQL